MPEIQSLTTPLSSPGYIYVITNLVNGKQYVGQTTGPMARRWSGHLSNARKSAKRPISHAIKKYGPEKFRIRIVATADSVEWLNILEPLFIDAYRTLVPAGYNLDSGGKNNRMHPDTKKLLSEIHRGKPAWNKGMPRSAETRAKISAAHKGKKMSAESVEKTAAKNRGRKISEEHKLRISEANKGKLRSPENMEKLKVLHTGKPLTDKHKARISTANKGRQLSVETRARMSVAQKGNQRWLGKKHSVETKVKMSIAQKGRFVSPETRSRMSIAKKGKTRASSSRKARSRQENQLLLFDKKD